MLQFKHSATDIISRVFVKLFTPAAEVTPSQWAAKNLVVPDGPRAGELWDATLTPYIIEPLDSMGPASPVNKIVVRKSAQTGFTVMAIAVVGHSIDCDPSGGILLVQPTEGALNDFIREKLNPAIEQSKPLKGKVKAQKSRDGEGSTGTTKRYPGGSMAMTIANSSAGLRSKTKRKAIKDEASEYPADLNKQGSPHAMIEARYESFRDTGDWKELNISTPTIKGVCYIDEQFHLGDQRYWHICCPGCGNKFPFRFGPDFRFNKAFPFNAHYVAPCCGVVIEANEKKELVRKAAPENGGEGGWIATAPGPGKFPSYHIDALSSSFVPWDLIAERWINAQSNPEALKGFYNLTLGEAYEVKGDAPDHVRLMERREDYRRGFIPHRALMLTAAADVQMNGIYVEVVAWAPNRESWVIETFVLDGDTTDANDGAFLKLAEVYNREWPDAFGGRRRIDAFAVDSGFRSHVVYAWVRSRHYAYAVDGRDGWNKPALGTPSLVDIDLNGHKIGSGKIWPVGTWSLKGHWYEDLRREGKTAGKEVDPPGFCHFGKWLDEEYFKQITSEYLADMRSRGRMTKAWQPRGSQANHFLDCRIYNMALADHLGVSAMTDDEWKSIARDRAPALDARDLFTLRPSDVPPAGQGESVPAVAVGDQPGVADAPPHTNASDVSRPVEQPPRASNWLGGRKSIW
jgi:phage terminase large subunit GpA-like protein